MEPDKSPQVIEQKPRCIHCKASIHSLIKNNKCLQCIKEKEEWDYLQNLYKQVA